MKYLIPDSSSTSEWSFAMRQLRKYFFKRYKNAGQWKPDDEIYAYLKTVKNAIGDRSQYNHWFSSNYGYKVKIPASFEFDAQTDCNDSSSDYLPIELIYPKE